MNKKRGIVLFLGLAVLAAIVVSLLFGGSRLRLSEIVASLLHPGGGDVAAAIVWKIRIPRIMLAVFVGMGLATSGCVLQGMLRNPLADPYTLGISGGAAFGATMATVSGLAALSVFALPLCAFLGSLVCFIAVYVTAARSRFAVNAMILIGVIYGFVFSSAVMLILVLAHPDKIQSSLFWLMGELSSAGPALVQTVSLLVLAGVGIFFFFARELNILTLGEEKASNLGVNAEKMKKIVFITASLITGACVSASGIVGFVGLIIPHGMRKIVGPDHKLLIPASAFGGAIFLTLCDTVARSISSQGELPLGVVTGLIGGVFFLFYLTRSVENQGVYPP